MAAPPHNGTVPHPSLPQSGALDVAAVVLLRPPAVPGLHRGGEGRVVHGVRQRHLPGPRHAGGEDGEERVRPLRRALAQEGGQGSAAGPLPAAGPPGVRPQRPLPAGVPPHGLGGPGGRGELHVPGEDPERGQPQRLRGGHLQRGRPRCQRHHHHAASR